VWLSPPPADSTVPDFCAVAPFVAGLMGSMLDRIEEDPDAVALAEPLYSEIMARVAGSSAACGPEGFPVSSLLTYTADQAQTRSGMAGELAAFLLANLCEGYGSVDTEAEAACAGT
jgi:hypothetical protein